MTDGLTARPRVWNKRDPSTPKDAVYVGRPTRFGNPYPLRHVTGALARAQERQRVINAYRALVARTPRLKTLIQAELRGKHLVCWCAPRPCHAEVLLEIANV